jgi:ribokinase
LIAKLGADALGDQALAGLQSEGIDVAGARRDPASATGVAMILVDAAGENSIAVASGANARLTVAEIDGAASVVREAALVMLQLEVPLDVVRRVAEIAAEAGVGVMLDPAPAAPLAPELLQLVTWLTPNEHEAEALTGVAVCDERSAREAALALRAAGAANVIVTLGARGAFVSGASLEALIPAQRVEAIDSTAAGDAFNGALACGLRRGLPLDEAAREATLAAALATTRLGAQPSLPTAAEVEQFRREAAI